MLSLSMMASSAGTLALAEGETASYNVGDLVWSEDFESFENGDDYAANPTNGIILGGGNGAVVSSTIKEDVSGDKYLYATATSAGSYSMQIPAGAAAQGDDKIFTIDVDMKFDTMETVTAEYNVGLGDSARGIGSYFTINPTPSNNANSSGFALNGVRTVANAFKQTIPGEEAKGNYRRIFASAWNTYRFIARKSSDGLYYADMYLNGAYFQLIGRRWGSGAQERLIVAIAVKSAAGGGVSIDNIKCYYGAVESNDYVTKGEFTVDKYTFDECVVGEYKYVNNEGGSEVVAGGNADHAFGVIKRYNKWGMNLDINSGKAGKAAGDNSLSVHSGGRVVFNNVNNDQGGNTAAYSTRYGTWVPEGDSLEFSSDILFKDLKENWLLQLEAAVDNQDIAIEITPNFYSLGDWESPDDFQNNRERIAPKIPLNTWVNVRIIITRGTAETYNKLTIYVDDNVICENKDITTWYTATNTTVDGKTTTTYGEPRKGDLLSKGLGKIYFQGECDYDNITIKKYLLGQGFTKPVTVPTLVDQTTKVADYPSLRGKAYTDGRSIQNVIDAMGITGDYVVRDASGNTVTDYTNAADGNYIEFNANGKKYYGAFVANNVVETINKTTGALGGFTFDETAVAVESVTKGAGREADDASILIKNISGADPETVNAVAGPRFVKEFNTDENAYMEFSFLADENTDFTVGYTVTYVRNGNKEGYSTKNGANRVYCDNIRISENVVQSTNSDNGYKKAGTYKNGEWTKVRFEWNSMNDNCIAVSVNDGAPVLMNNGIPAYLKTLKQITITPAANTSVVLDDIIVMEGYKSAPTAGKISDITEAYVYNFDGTISIPAYYSNVFMSMNALGNSINVSPLTAAKKWIKADGSKASGNFDAVDKLVLVNDGIYKYYPVKNREGITEIKNENGTSKMIVDVINDNIDDLTGSKFITAVYNKEDGTLVGAVMYDMEFAEDASTSEFEITPQSFDSETQTMKYFAWKLENMECLCDALEYNK